MAAQDEPAAPVEQATDEGEERAPFLETDEPVRDFIMEPELPSDPSRLVFTLGAGSSLRVVKHLDFEQQRFAPSFINVMAGWVLPGSGALRSGLFVDFSTNLTGDGTQARGVDPFDQFILGISYGLNWAMLGHNAAPDLVARLRVGPAFSFGPTFNVGADVALGFSWLFTRGFGIYAEGVFGFWFGGEDRDGATTLHPILSGEVGITFDFEVL